jgi:hypothetical protein
LAFVVLAVFTIVATATATATAVAVLAIFTVFVIPKIIIEDKQ